MDFALTEEQGLLRHSVQRLFADHYAFDARKRYAQEPGGYSRALWAPLCRARPARAAVR